MTNVSEWSTAAGSNNSAPPDGWPENMLPGKVNDCAREMMAALSKWYKDSSSIQNTAGTGAAYTLTTNSVHTALSDVPLLTFRVHTASTGACTLNVDGLGAKPLRKNGNLGDYASGELKNGQTLVVTYNSNTDDFEVVGPGIENLPSFTAAQILALILTVDGAGSGLDADLLDGSSSAVFATAANLTTTNTNVSTINSTAMFKANNLSDVSNASTSFGNIKQAATTGATGVVQLATQAEVETATDAAKVAPLSIMQNHPGMCKCWGRTTGGATPSLQANYNVTSITDSGVGQLTVTIATDFSSANYCVVALPQEDGAASTNKAVKVQTTGYAAGAFVLLAELADGSNSDPDNGFNWACFGDQ